MELNQNLMNKIEERSNRSFKIVDLETRDGDDGIGIIEGYAVVFNSKTNIADLFFEEIRSDAIKPEALEDVVFLTNHNSKMIALARSRRNNANSTLQLSVDAKGLKVIASVDIQNNVEARSLYSAIKRGDIDGMSFAMIISGYEWRDLESDMPTRIITSIEHIYDVCAVNFPAYDNTEIYARAEDDTLVNEKRALENARASVLGNTKELELAKRKALFKVKKLN